MIGTMNHGGFGDDDEMPRNAKQADSRVSHLTPDEEWRFIAIADSSAFQADGWLRSYLHPAGPAPDRSATPISEARKLSEQAFGSLMSRAFTADEQKDFRQVLSIEPPQDRPRFGLRDALLKRLKAGDEVPSELYPAYNLVESIPAPSRERISSLPPRIAEAFEQLMCGSIDAKTAYRLKRHILPIGIRQEATPLPEETHRRFEEGMRHLFKDDPPQHLLQPKEEFDESKYVQNALRRLRDIPLRETIAYPLEKHESAFEALMVPLQESAKAGKWVEWVSVRGAARERVDLSPDEYARFSHLCSKIEDHLMANVANPDSSVFHVLFGYGDGFIR